MHTIVKNQNNQPPSPQSGASLFQARAGTNSRLQHSSEKETMSGFDTHLLHNSSRMAVQKMMLRSVQQMSEALLKDYCHCSMTLRIVLLIWY